MNKPLHVFDRESEWRALSRFAGDELEGPALGIVYGRRRLGKSLLLDALSEATGGFYHLAVQQDEALALRSFGEDLARFAGAPGPIILRDWSAAIEALFGLAESRSVVAVIDEFPYLAAGSPSLPSIIQAALGPTRRRQAGCRLRLILCGSAMSIMGRLLSGGAPLRGRAGLDLIVRPFDLVQAADFWGLRHDTGLAFRVHAILGGTPAYRDLLRGQTPKSLKSFDSWVSTALFDPSSPLFREGRYLLAEEPGISDRSLYHSILSAIARGQTRTGQIAAMLGRAQTSLAHPLNVLRDIGLVSCEQDAIVQRRPSYRVSDPMLRFYHAIILPRLRDLEAGRGRQVWSESEGAFSTLVAGPHFEDMARWWTGNYANQRGFAPPLSIVASAVVNDPAGRARHQVDVAGLTATGRGELRTIAVLGEAKWQRTPVGAQELDRLAAIRAVVNSSGKADAANARLLLFSASGFTESLRRRAAQEGAVLVDLETLYGQ